METYFQGLIWSVDKLNLTCIREFNQLIYVHFGPKIFKEMQHFTKIDEELRHCFSSIEPSANEIKEYLEKFCIRYDINDFGFGNKKNNNQTKGGVQNNKSNVDDLDTTLAKLKMECPYDKIYQKPTDDNSYNNPFNSQKDNQHIYISTSPHMFQNQGYPQQNYSEGFKTPSFVSNSQQIDIKPQINQSQFQKDFPTRGSMPIPINSTITPIPINTVISEAPHINDDNNYDIIGDEHIKQLIESNIQKSYIKGMNSNKLPVDFTDINKVSEQANIDDLIIKLKDLGITIPYKRLSGVKHTAQNCYTKSKFDINDYKIGLGDNKKHNK